MTKHVTADPNDANATSIEARILRLATLIAAIILIGLQLYQQTINSRIEKKTDQAVVKTDEVHDLVNSQKGVALHLRVAELTRLWKVTNLDEDKLTLDQAIKDAKAHDEAMNKIDEEHRLAAGGKP